VKVYLAGPMRGVKDFNFPAFDAATARGRALGHDVLSPAEEDRKHGFEGIGKQGRDDEWESALGLLETVRRDLAELLACDAIALLPGSEFSTGARAEEAVAEFAKMAILSAEDFMPLERTQKRVYLIRGDADGRQD